MSAILRELQVMRGFAACGEDDAKLDEAEAEYRELVAIVNGLLRWVSKGLADGAYARCVAPDAATRDTERAITLLRQLDTRS